MKKNILKVSLCLALSLSLVFGATLAGASVTEQPGTVQVAGDDGAGGGGSDLEPIDELILWV